MHGGEAASIMRSTLKYNGPMIGQYNYRDIFYYYY